MSKVYAVTGVSKKDGKWAVRYANSMSRKNVLVRNGHDHVHLFVLEDAVSKEDCVDFLLNQKFKLANKAAFEAVKAEARLLGFLV